MKSRPNNQRFNTSPSKLEGAGGRVSNRIEAHTPHPNLGEQVLRTKNTANMKLFRRELRNNSTKAEKTLWNLLRGKSINGLQFRRQYSVDDKILDFYCPKIKLAIELDGDYHYHGGMIASDADRDQSLLKSYGITTLRFENSIVIEKPWIVANSIRNYVDSTTSPSKLEGDGGSVSNITKTHSKNTSPSKLEGEDRRSGGVCHNYNKAHTPHPNLGELV